MACRSKPSCDYRLWITTPLLYRFITVSVNESVVVFDFTESVSHGLSEYVNAAKRNARFFCFVLLSNISVAVSVDCNTSVLSFNESIYSTDNCFTCFVLFLSVSYARIALCWLCVLKSNKTELVVTPVARLKMTNKRFFVDMIGLKV